MGLNEIHLSQSTNEIRCLEHLPKSAPSCNIIIHIILFNSKVHCNLLNVMHGCNIMHRTSYLLLFLQLSDPTCNSTIVSQLDILCVHGYLFIHCAL